MIRPDICELKKLNHECILILYLYSTNFYSKSCIFLHSFQLAVKVQIGNQISQNDLKTALLIIFFSVQQNKYSLKVVRIFICKAIKSALCSICFARHRYLNCAEQPGVKLRYECSQRPECQFVAICHSLQGNGRQVMGG